MWCSAAAALVHAPVGAETTRSARVLPPMPPLARAPTGAAVAAAGKADSPDAKVDALSLSFLARQPAADERTVATEALTTGLGLSDVAWALANTREFLFIQ